MDIVELYEQMVATGFDSDYAMHFVADSFRVSYDDVYSLLFYL